MKFTFNGSGLAGKDIVVFEELLLIDEDSRYVVAEHKDIEDEGQTVRLTEIPRKPGPKTGDDSNGLYWLILAGMAALVIGGKVISSKRKNKNDNETK